MSEGAAERSVLLLTFSFCVGRGKITRAPTSKELPFARSPLPPSLARPCNTACEFANISRGILISQRGSMDGQFFRLTRQKATLLSRMTR